MPSLMLTLPFATLKRSHGRPSPNMASVSLAEAKAHLRVDYPEDDAYVSTLINAAEGYISEIGVPADKLASPPVKHAALLLIGHWFAFREAAAEKPPQAIAFGVDALVQPFREVSF
ncbi:phage gp6-like head-tail connector protein [Agrobacterium salinitolerans]|uniref:Phage gp6-like head-tail connector protein n=2 Tax=Rhizobium/Agrobacterium group TaxID=227290 RepID=A0ABY3BRL6_9HYPH|nr:phage gp6-like head-tail connector protein [Agrobacterium salinitolerans]